MTPLDAALERWRVAHEEMEAADGVLRAFIGLSVLTVRDLRGHRWTVANGAVYTNAAEPDYRGTFWQETEREGVTLVLDSCYDASLMVLTTALRDDTIAARIPREDL